MSASAAYAPQPNKTPEKVRADWWEALPGARFYAGHHEVEATPEKIGSVIAAIVMYLFRLFAKIRRIGNSLLANTLNQTPAHV